ncbi:type I restriction enzyme, R subunit [Rhodoplanes sp. JGI PP 4-B12]|uniref:EcoAI/FtnUII family type I restriction enzme subunit R n=1 Tax=Rhodoplanes sp. JGI PP 4-B12 TaxID=1873883 RepID=UPI000B50D91E|nr:type I restriction endonuclease subunit R [Rhodoplanes sp. JGI PP 4-B12]SNB55664.1 type I restriction enzyme, R subunit [Rhodoplanes sp. JGI PP 4-B12]
MNEAETRAELIDPALRGAGWGVVPDSRVRREMIAPGRIEGAGRRGKPEIADYVLTFRNHKLAVIEAKAHEKGDTEGVGQAKAYAEKLQARFAYSTNGRRIYRIDMATGKEGYVERYPTPDELWAEVFKTPNEWRDRFAAVPFEERGGTWQTRYYQHNAIENALEAIAAGKQRILLTLATGTGKTAIAFQIAWALFQSRWILSRKPERRPRGLFLADRNILADQAYNAFSAFPEDALVRIKPDEIRKKGRVPKNASIFFTIFQTFMSGTGVDGQPAPYFGDYPPDFFDFIVIDECHRGGANDESNWRGILEYFAPAVQLGLTATPKRRDNVDTYAYFGEPVYVYSLKDGINDGFLTPFKVKQIATTLDDYLYTPDDKVVEGEIEEGKRYREPQFNRTIEIEERERYRVKLFMDQIDQREKTLVFCANQPHALLVRDLINQMKTSSDPNYCVRVTADDGALGEQWLRTFQDNEKTIPTILTTSQKLSTGVNARNVRNIVLMRPIGTMIEFKQIIGRGTRLFDGKDYFTIYDFVKAYEHFNDPEWDGEPMEPIPHQPRVPGGMEEEGDDYEGTPTPPRPQKIKIRLADGKERTIQSMMATSYWSPDGKPISANQMVERLFGELPRFFKDEDELRRLWSKPDTRKALLQGLAEKGFGSEQLAEISRMINAEKSDVFDVLAYIAFALAPITRLERVETRKGNIFARYDGKLQAFIDFVLAQYVQQGVDELDQDKLSSLLQLKYHSVPDAIDQLGEVPVIRDTFIGFIHDEDRGQTSCDITTPK